MPGSKRNAAGLALVLGVGLFPAACGGGSAGGSTTASMSTAASGSGAGGKAEACAPGAQVACACPGEPAGGTMGAQVCKGDGSGFGPCEGCGHGGAGGMSTSTGGHGGTGGIGGMSTGTGGAGGAGSTTSSTTASAGGAGGAPMCPVIDCSDKTCVDYECVDAVPAGWEANGYVTLYEGPAGNTPPNCPAELSNIVYMGNASLNAQGAQCSTCGCMPPMGQNCQLQTDLNPTTMGIQAMQVSNAMCNVGATQLNTLTVPDPPWGGACFHDEMLPGGQLCNGAPCNTSVQSSLATVTGGTCAATGGTPQNQTPTWGLSALGCSGPVTNKGCAGQQVCMLKPPAPFKPHVCAEQTGDVECPAGSTFSNKYLYYGGFMDNRGCTSCTCGGASGGSCDITISLYSDPPAGVCATSVGTFKAGQCLNLSGNPGIFGWTDVASPPSGGSCMPTVSSPTGQVMETSPTTFCCQ